MIKIAKCAANFLKISNTNFWAGIFEDYNVNNTYDVVLSFANHSTYDHNTQQSIDDYFKKCARYVNADGLLLFESHLPSYEKPEQLIAVLEVLQRYFKIQTQYKLTQGTHADQGRTFAVCTKLP